ncbi:major facilitator superfamily transporter [Thozetella sp. PMI_491]|nr:major facilitator superfamily transporter [Thozetella sp. PMI_491]
MATTTSTTTSIQLNTLGPFSSLASTRDASTASVDRPSDRDTDDPVLEASRLADSAVPDGGYGWVVIMGAAVVSWWYTGLSYSWGVMQAALVRDNLSSPATLSFVGSVSTALIAALAIVNARAIRWLGAQRTGILGVLFLGISTLLSSFAVKNIAGLFFTSGILLGLGMSLCFMTVTTTPAQYFSRKRGLANGIVFAGGGLGASIISITLDPMIQKFGPAWAYRVLALATLVTGLPAAWLIKERAPIRTAGFIEWNLFRDLKFLLVFATGFIGTFPLFVAPFFLPMYSVSIGFSPSTGAALLAGFNFSSAVGRIMSGYFCDKLGPLNTLFTALLLTALSMLALWPTSTTLAPLIAFVIINGAANGGFFATMATVVGNTFGSARVAVAMGMVVTGWGAGYLMGAPIAGYLLDAYGGADNGLQAYRPAMFYAGSLALAAAGLIAMMRLRISTKLLQKL